MGGSQSQYRYVDLCNDAPPPNTLEKEYIWNDLLNVINQKTYYISAEDIMEIVYKVILKESHTKNIKEMLSKIRKTIRHKEHIKWFQSIVWLKIFIDRLKPNYPLNNYPLNNYPLNNYPLNNCPN